MAYHGAGKTYLAERLQKEIDTAWYNADEVRKMADDWDFQMKEDPLLNHEKTFADFEKVMAEMLFVILYVRLKVP